MEEKVLSSIDAAALMHQSGWDFRRAWKGKIDCSVWVKAQLRDEGRMYLVLQYTDREQKKTVPIDRCLGVSSASRNIMLNGRVEIAGNGPLKQFSVILKHEGCDGIISTEEFHLKFPEIKTNLRELHVNA